MANWRLGVLGIAGAAMSSLAVPAAAQTMWWVEGDRFCGGFSNNFRNNIMCGAPRRGETLPSSTFRYEFDTPSVNLDRPPPPPAAVVPPPAPGTRAAPRRN